MQKESRRDGDRDGSRCSKQMDAAELTKKARKPQRARPDARSKINALIDAMQLEGVHPIEAIEDRLAAGEMQPVAPFDDDPVGHGGPKAGLDEAHAVFRRWFGEEYDLEALDAVLAASAVERLAGDPLWLMLVSGSGNAKTETVAALSGVGAHLVSTIASEAALLSGTPNRERAKDATGGLLRQIGSSGTLVIKDVTSILSANRDTRAMVLAALREVHDGRWVRTLGTDGGKTLSWAGRCIVIGAVTTAWDAAHSVIAAMGDRFLLLRMDSSVGRIAAGRQSRLNVGLEEQMRAELADAVASVIAGMNHAPDDVTEEESEMLLAAADLVTRARTAVEADYQGNVIDAHAPEMPTRFMKQLVQVVRGALAIGMDRSSALSLAMRCARDSMPPLRLACVDDIAAHQGATTNEVRKRLDKPRNTVDRTLQALHMLGVLTVAEEDRNDAGKFWRYSLAQGINPSSLLVPKMSVSGVKGCEEGFYSGSDISGTSPRCPRCDGSGCSWCE